MRAGAAVRQALDSAKADLGDPPPGQDTVKHSPAPSPLTPRALHGGRVSREGTWGAAKPCGVHVDGAPRADLGLPRCSRLGKRPRAAVWARSQPVPGVLLSQAMLP